MSNENKHNLEYFENSSMRELYESMQNWQNKYHKRLLSVNIQKEGSNYCCIALTNPSEVVIVAQARDGGSYCNNLQYKEIMRDEGTNKLQVSL